MLLDRTGLTEVRNLASYLAMAPFSNCLWRRRPSVGLVATRTWDGSRPFAHQRVRATRGGFVAEGVATTGTGMGWWWPAG
jgi:hypothetical protein